MKLLPNLDRLRALTAEQYVALLVEDSSVPVVVDAVGLAELRGELARRKLAALAAYRKAKARPDFDEATAMFPLGRIALAHHSIERSVPALRAAVNAPYFRLATATTMSGKVAVGMVLGVLDIIESTTEQALRWEKPLRPPLWIEELRDLVSGLLTENGFLAPVFPEGGAST